MKKILLTTFTAFIIHLTYAQNTVWPATTSSDYVGIGTTNPQSNLDIGKNTPTPSLRIGNSGYGTSYNSIWGLQPGAASIMIFGNNNVNEIRAGNTGPGGFLDFYTNNTADYTAASNGYLALHLGANGYVSIGTTSPADIFQVNGGTTLRFQVAATKGVWVNNEVNGGTPGSQGPLYLNYSSTGNTLLNSNGGNVGIGTTDPAGYKLAVNGNIRAKEIKVETGWSDYVFYPTYKLLPLAEVAKYIKTNQHLPDVPSAGEVAKNGINVGETNALLLKKIEELTLYLIEKDTKDREKDEKLIDQQTMLLSQQKEINQLRRQVETLLKKKP